MLDFLPEYTKQAEDLLSKSLKLMPTKKEAWDALGNVYWKKRDLDAAKKCFESSLEQDENDVELLRNLSMVTRQCSPQASGATLRPPLRSIAHSVQRFRQARKFEPGNGVMGLQQRNMVLPQRGSAGVSSTSTCRRCDKTWDKVRQCAR